MIPFLILAGIFLVSGVTNKNQTGAHLVVFILCALLTKLGPMRTSRKFSRTYSGVRITCKMGAHCSLGACTQNLTKKFGCQHVIIFFMNLLIRKCNYYIWLVKKIINLLRLKEY
jgi:hypothetical protein